MNILHVYKDYFPVLGGIENHIKVLAEAQAAQGHQVIVSVCSLTRQSHVDSDAAHPGLKILRSGRLTTLASMPISLSQPLAIWRLKPDIVHVHGPYPLGELSAWLFKRRIPLVITHHSDVVRQAQLLRLYGPLLKQVYKHAARILPTSETYMASSKWLQPVRDHCQVVPLGVDEQRFTPPASTFNGPPTLLFVGRLRYYKGLDTLLRALPSIPDCQLKVVGTGPMQAEWQALTENLDIQARVDFLGEVSDEDLPDVYQQASLFVLPANARSEAFGMVLLEAMASGLPCVTTEIGSGTSWVVQDGVTGKVVPPQNEQALAEAINTLLQDEALRAKMAQAARQRVENEFTNALMVERVLQAYEACLDKR